ncbi:NAD(+) synthase [Geomonas subterranea]|uniref:NH(3)-dependent NAD(+) synthetase n=1 Tax=Geomonas subterranea TaxID=2847989 RepID=A0ABX8LFW0_9BACT|nr:NAD(+) synthase [Geomonas subterranea]QXE90877.1 NAD(+) synthase [Geomonas subterranea]QXM11039.1 NAD(+) synthase [Geomonas subterranea]
MTMTTGFFPDVLRLDPQREADRICARIKELMRDQVKRGGVVVALSGGIDSSVTAALSVRALGRERVVGLEMPERHSARETLALSGKVAGALGIRTQVEDISGILQSVGFYEKYDSAVRMVVPEYGDGWASKIVISGVKNQPRFTSFYLVTENTQQVQSTVRLPLQPYLEIVAATNFKQRIRKMLEYYHADRLNYAVAGTPNRLEYDQGFFVKLGDGAADIKPIAHLYKSQVYQLAEFLGIPEEIRSRKPTTDTYSLAQGQDEFYFSLPYQMMDLCLYAHNHGVPAENVAPILGLEPQQVRMVYRDIDVKRKTTRYLHLPPLLVEEVAWE